MGAKMSMVLTQVYLEAAQKKALTAHAKRSGRKVAEVMRDAVDAALLGVTTDELTRLDEASRKAGEFIDAIRVDLANNTKEHNSFMRQITKLRNAP
jgi:flavodoxin